MRKISIHSIITLLFLFHAPLPAQHSGSDTIGRTEVIIASREDSDSFVLDRSLLPIFSDNPDSLCTAVDKAIQYAQSYYHEHDYNLALKHSLLAVSLYTHIHPKSYELAERFNRTAVLYYFLSDYDQALEFLKKSSKICEQTNDDHCHMMNLFWRAKIYRDKSDYIQSSKCNQEMFQKGLKSGNFYGACISLNQIGIAHNYDHHYAQAIDVLNHGLILLDSVEVSSKRRTLRTSIYQNLATAYLLQNSYEKAEQYYMESMSLLEEEGQPNQIANGFLLIGNLYKAQQKNSLAKNYYKKALVLYEKIDQGMTSKVLHNLGFVHLDSGNYKDAINHLNRSLELSEKLGLHRRTAYACLGLGKTYLETKDHERALYHALRARDIHGDLNILSHTDEIQELLAQIYTQMGNYEKAYHHFQQFKTLSDSIANETLTRKVIELEYKYKYRDTLLQAKATERDLNQQVDEVNQSLVNVENQRAQAIIATLILVLIIATLLFFWRLNTIQSKHTKVLAEQKLLRSQMAPHFVFNSLTTLQRLILSEQPTKATKYLTSFAKLLRLSLENSRWTLVPLNRELEAIQRYIDVQNIGKKETFQYTLNIRGIENLQNVSVPPMIIQPFVENAIEHAFTQKNESNHISVQIGYKTNKLTCRVIDNGVGISSDKIHKTQSKSSLSSTITSERLDILAKAMKQDAGLIFIDRNTYGKQGTEVQITLPHRIVNRAYTKELYNPFKFAQ